MFKEERRKKGEGGEKRCGGRGETPRRWD